MGALAACLPLVTHNPFLAVERPAISESVRADVELLGDRRQVRSAIRRLGDLGSTIVPELITALEDTLMSGFQPTRVSTRDPRTTSDTMVLPDMNDSFAVRWLASFVTQVAKREVKSPHAAVLGPLRIPTSITDTSKNVSI